MRYFVQVKGEKMTKPTSARLTMAGANRVIKQSITFLYNLLGPSHAACMVCGKSTNYGGGEGMDGGSGSSKGNGESYRNNGSHGSSGVHSRGQASFALPVSISHQLCKGCLASISWISVIRCSVCGRSVHCEDCVKRSDAQLIANRSAVNYDEHMREWLAQYKYRGSERLQPLLTAMLFPVFEQLTAELYARSRERLNARPNIRTMRQDGGQGWLDEAPSLLRKRLSTLMKSLLGMRLGSGKEISSALRASLWDAITYVPISPERAGERGFNQAEQMAAGLAAQYGLPIVPLLLRTRDSDKQSFKTRQQRVSNVGGLFAPLPDAPANLDALRARKCMVAIREQPLRQQMNCEPNQPLRLLLVDDIYTTGSTVHSCARALMSMQDRPLEIYALTWARS
ncbi:ComF family protein [Paenibacillaceae bacterium]|nr:ComF family protein [Paenibacillaceae bacterium]